MRGWLSYINRWKSPEDQIFAYGRLHRFLESYRDTRVLDFDAKAVEIYKELKSKKIRVGTTDLKIAPIAVANSALLISRNLTDFERVPNLSVEDWTQPNSARTN